MLNAQVVKPATCEECKEPVDARLIADRPLGILAKDWNPWAYVCDNCGHEHVSANK